MKRCWFPASKGTAQFIRPGIDGFWRERPLSGVKVVCCGTQMTALFVVHPFYAFYISIISFLYILFLLTSGRWLHCG